MLFAQWTLFCVILLAISAACTKAENKTRVSRFRKLVDGLVEWWGEYEKWVDGPSAFATSKYHLNKALQRVFYIHENSKNITLTMGSREFRRVGYAFKLYAREPNLFSFLFFRPAEDCVTGVEQQFPLKINHQFPALRFEVSGGDDDDPPCKFYALFEVVYDAQRGISMEEVFVIDPPSENYNAPEHVSTYSFSGAEQIRSRNFSNFTGMQAGAVHVWRREQNLELRREKAVHPDDVNSGPYAERYVWETQSHSADCRVRSAKHNESDGGMAEFPHVLHVKVFLESVRRYEEEFQVHRHLPDNCHVIAEFDGGMFKLRREERTFARSVDRRFEFLENFCYYTSIALLFVVFYLLRAINQTAASDRYDVMCALNREVSEPGCRIRLEKDDSLAASKAEKDEANEQPNTTTATTNDSTAGGGSKTAKSLLSEKMAVEGRESGAEKALKRLAQKSQPNVPPLATTAAAPNPIRRPP